jgi:hypothetical protein
MVLLSELSEWFELSNPHGALGTANEKLLDKLSKMLSNPHGALGT